MRPCKFNERIRGAYDETTHRSKIIETVSVGTWLSWGTDFYEFESGGAEYSAGIIEMEDGKIKLIRADDIQFTDKDGAQAA
jgi:hypothetical protein